MGENSKIEWTHHTYNPWSRLAVLKFVARLAERNAVRDVESQFGIVGKGLDVMGVEVPAARIAAPLAGEVVTAEHVEAPSLVLHRKALVTALRQLAFFMKQMGGVRDKRHDLEDMPEDLRIREFPEVPA